MIKRIADEYTRQYPNYAKYYKLISSIYDSQYEGSSEESECSSEESECSSEESEETFLHSNYYKFISSECEQGKLLIDISDDSCDKPIKDDDAYEVITNFNVMNYHESFVKIHNVENKAEEEITVDLNEEITIDEGNDEGNGGYNYSYCNIL